MHSFNEHHPEFKGFSDYYHREVFPLLAVRDGERREALRNTVIFGLIVSVITIFTAVYLFNISENSQPSFIALFVGGGFPFEDQMSGQAHGAEFNSVEVHLERKGDKSWHTVMLGQLMTLTFPRKFLGRTVVLRDKGFLQGKKKGDMKRVGLADPVFEKIFEAYSTDQVESRYIARAHAKDIGRSRRGL